MHTYNDLQLCVTEEEKIEFIKKAISEHESSDEFKIGQEAGFFYRHRDRELEKIKKFVYDREGNAYTDESTPNHKITSNFFYIFTVQLVSYLLGNGVSFDNPDVKKKLGDSKFDYQLQQIFTYAVCDGRGYGFVDGNSITPLCFACKIHGDEPYLIPLKDEDDGKIKSAIRYWRLCEDKPLQVTLYEPDGFTKYKEIDEELVLFQEKQPYKIKTVSNDIQGTYNSTGYSAFPIVEMRFTNNQSSLVGNRSKLFAYDVVLSGMVNNVDMNSLYWVLKNADGMDKADDMRFVAGLSKTHVLHMNEEVEVTTLKTDVNPESHEAVLDRLRKQLFLDFMAVDVERIASGNITTVEIKAAYQNLNLKCDEAEKYVDEFIRGCLRVKGLNENEPFHFKRPNDINQSEFLTTLVQIASILGEDTTLKLVCETLGMIDEYESIKAQRDTEALARMSIAENSQDNNSIDDVADSADVIASAVDEKGKALNGVQIQSLINIIGQLTDGKITENQAVKIVATSIGVSDEKAREIIRGE